MSICFFAYIFMMVSGMIHVVIANIAARISVRRSIRLTVCLRAVVAWPSGSPFCFMPQ